MQMQLKKIRWGDLSRPTPISRDFGYNRGLPLDRYYIETFLAQRASDIHGRVLEIGDATYTRQFGQERVTHSDVLHVSEGNPAATIVGSLTDADHVPSNAFDCIVLTQTLHLIVDVHTALRTLYRILKPGGTVLATFPGISQVSRDEWAATWSWSFTHVSARRLFATYFSPECVTLTAYGNAFAATAFLHGLSVDEISRDELDTRDPRYEMLLAVRAAKPVTTQ